MSKTTSPDVEGIKVSVDKAPGGTPAGSPISIGHLESIGSLIDKSRSSKKYTPLNNKDYEEIVSLGSMTQGPFTFDVLYDPEIQEGVNSLNEAIDANEEVQLILELNNPLDADGSGTKITALCKVSSFKVDGEKDGKLLAKVTAEKLGKPTTTAATSGA